MTRFRPVFILCALVAVAALYATPGGGDSARAAGSVISISAGDEHTCVVLADGGVQCWGDNSSGQLGDGTNNPSTTPVDVCASGSGNGCSGGARLTGMVSVKTGIAHSCGLTDNGGVKCWGSNGSGQLGDGTTMPRTNPVDVCASGSGASCSGGEPLTGVEQVDAGGGSNCALMANTGIKCWGSDLVGQLGIGTPNPAAGNGSVSGGFGGFETNPQDVCDYLVAASSDKPSTGEQGGVVIINPCAAITGFAGVATGDQHACGLTTDGGAKCWGDNIRGRLGDGTESQSSVPVDVCSYSLLSGGTTSGVIIIPCTPVSGLVEIKAGGQYTCARTAEGGARCWGTNSSGQLGDGTEDNRFTPVTVCASGSGAGCTALGGITAISAGSSTTCAIAAAGDARCWGANFVGQIGDGSTDERLNPAPVSGHSSGVALIGGGPRGRHVCAAMDDGRLRCWGWNSEGQLGRDSTGGLNEAFPNPETVVGFGPKPTPTPTDTPPPDATNTPTATAGMPTATPTPGAGGLIGDVNCDGQVTAVDAALLLQLAAGLLGALPCPENADVNGDGSVTAVDAALVLQFAAGLLGSLPP